MELPVSGGKFLFTVEQLELIRRLRNSGLTKQQVLSAFDSFERLDNQLGDVYSIPLSLALQAQQLQQLAASGTTSVAHISSLQTVTASTSELSYGLLQQPIASISVLPQLQLTPSSANNTSLLLQQAANSVNSDNISRLPSQFDGELQTESRETTSTVAFNQRHLASVAICGFSQTAARSCTEPKSVGVSELGSQSMSADEHDGVHSETVVTQSESVLEQQQLQQSSARHNLVNGHRTAAAATDDDNHWQPHLPSAVECKREEPGEVDSNELMQFLALGEVSCCEEIKAFVAKHNIKQQQIAFLAGVSQPYVSRYLKGDFTVMSERCCRSIKKWYLAYRKNPKAIRSAAANAAKHGTMTLKKLVAIHSSSNNDSVSSASVPSHSDILQLLSRVARHDRFVFQHSQLEMLEELFVEDSYPSYERREQIADLCNTSLEASLGRRLSEKERVTVQVISNWFANKRYNLRKRLKEENNNTEARQLVSGADYDATQLLDVKDGRLLNIAGHDSTTNTVTIEDTSVNAGHMMNTASQSPSNSPSCCVIQSVYSLPIH